MKSKKQLINMLYKAISTMDQMLFCFMWFSCNTKSLL